MAEARLGAFHPPDLPDLDGIRACVHCGICVPACPSFRVLGEEMDSPRGRVYLMRAVAEGRLEITETFRRHIDLCLGCRGCETACPSGVPFGRLLEATRAQIARHGPPPRAPRFERLVFGLFPRPRRLGLALRLLRLAELTGLRRAARASGLLGLSPSLARMEALLPRVPRRRRLRRLTRAPGGARGRVGLLTGCIQRWLQPDVHRATIRLLALAGWDVVVPRGQGCCGALELHAGRIDDFRARARALVGAFPADLDAIVTSAAGCGSAMKAYDHWLDGPGDGASFARRVRDVSEVLAEAAALPLGPLDLTVTYHDACHLAHGQGVRAEPRALLARIPGLRLVPLADSELCCGSAGVYNLVEPEVADRLLTMKVARIEATDAEVVAAGNPGCAFQIEQGLRARGLPIEVVHPVELLARSVDAARAARPATAEVR